MTTTQAGTKHADFGACPCFSRGQLKRSTENESPARPISSQGVSREQREKQQQQQQQQQECRCSRPKRGNYGSFWATFLISGITHQVPRKSVPLEKKKRSRRRREKRRESSADRPQRGVLSSSGSIAVDGTTAASFHRS